MCCSSWQLGKRLQGSLPSAAARHRGPSGLRQMSERCKGLQMRVTVIDVKKADDPLGTVTQLWPTLARERATAAQKRSPAESSGAAARMVSATCKCGKCKVTQRVHGGMLYAKCHCSHCRQWFEDDPTTKGEYAGVLLDWCCNVKVEGPTDGKLTCGGCCPSDEHAPRCGICWGGGMHRIKCKECKQPVILYGLGMGFGLAATNAAMFDRELGTEKQVFKPTMQIFYNSGLRPGIEPCEEKITYHGELLSLSCIAYQTLKAVCAYGTGNCCCLPGKASPKVAPGAPAPEVMAH